MNPAEVIQLEMNLFKKIGLSNYCSASSLFVWDGESAATEEGRQMI
jgi:hypothetical protein